MATISTISQNSFEKVVKVSNLTNVGDSPLIAAASEGWRRGLVQVGDIHTPPAYKTGVVLQAQSAGQEASDIMADGTLRPLRQFMTVAGDGTGSIESNFNYAAAETEFKLVPPGDHVAYVARLIFSLQDSNALVDGKWGQDIILTNGIKFQVRNASGVVHDLLGPNGDTYITGDTWKVNEDLGAFCYDSDKSGFKSGDSTGHARWTFIKCGCYLVLDGAKGEYLAFTLKDDFTGLTHQHFWLEGFFGTRNTVKDHPDRRAAVDPDSVRTAGTIAELPSGIIVPAHVDAAGDFDVIITLQAF